MSKWERLDYSSFHHETCRMVYEQLDSDRCVRLRHGPESKDWSGAHWCYVPRDCSSLNGGHPVVSTGLIWSTDRDVSLKRCGPGEPSMADVSPQELGADARRWAASGSPEGTLDLG